MNETPPRPVSYADAGVDINSGAELVEQIKPAVARTKRAGVAGELGGFGGLFALAECGYKDPILVSATDGVGTKLKLAIDSDRHETVGIDLVAMCVNDLIVQGAEPLFFLDYFATGKLDVEAARQIIEGIARGCELAGAALLGGETAEMPDMYRGKDYDLAGFSVGAVERDKLITGAKIAPGDAIVALASSGLHSNGYSLVRRIIETQHTAFDTPFGNATLIDVLLEPTRIYVNSILDVMAHFELRGIAHITGGGLSENIPRVLPIGTCANINLDSWQCPEIFSWLAHNGPVEPSEMLKTFNCGVGMVLIVPKAQAAALSAALNALGEQAFEIGNIGAGSTTVVNYTGTLLR